MNDDGAVISSQSGVSRRAFLNTAFGVLADAAATQGRNALATPTNWGGGIPPGLPLPLQPFTVELLNDNRGRWKFLDWDGQHLHLKGPVQGLAFPATGQPGGKIQAAYLCCDPEFPRDPVHGYFRLAASISKIGSAERFRIQESYFSCTVAVRRACDSMFECALEDIFLGPAVSGDQYIEGLYLVINGKPHIIWLGPAKAQTGPQIRLLTDRVGNVFVDGEPTRIMLVGLRPRPREQSRHLDVTVRATAYDTGRMAWRAKLELTLEAGRITSRAVDLPIKRFGIFELTVESNGRTVANLRICRIPAPQPIHPEVSSIGINIFQQQIWWYAFQIPLMARAGVHWIRPWLWWENTWRVQEPKPGRWDFRALDAALRRMELHGMRYQNMFYAAPKWVSESRVPPATKAGLNVWSRYIRKVVARYRGRIRYHEVWNEPPNDGVNAKHYLAMLKAAWRAAKDADPNCKIFGLSERYGGNLTWLMAVLNGGGGAYMDAATIHVYVPPSQFLCEARKRQRALDEHHVHRLWINELGTTAYDFSVAYSKKYDCSERKQAAVLVEEFAEARVLESWMKTFWFCTYDPRDAAHPSGWTWDAGIGLLYLGFLPKLAYAALAGFASVFDGRKCLGRVANVRERLVQVSFEGPVTVVWPSGRQLRGKIPATHLGCLPMERLTVMDMFSNILDSGNAADVLLDFSHGPLYLEGSGQLAKLAAK